MVAHFKLVGRQRGADMSIKLRRIVGRRIVGRHFVGRHPWISPMLA